MIRGWLRQFALKAQAKAGLSSGVAVWAAIAAIGALLTCFFLALAAFVALSQRYGPLTASLTLAGFFVLVGIVGIVACLAIRRANVKRAELELAARKNANTGLLGLDPQLLTLGFQVGRSIGLGRIIGLAAAGILAAGLAKEWFNRDDPDEDADEPPVEP